MSVRSFLMANGYKYRSPDGKGTVRRIYQEYDVYASIEVYCRVLGKKHGTTWLDYIGRTYGWTTTKTNTSYNAVRLVGVDSDTRELFAVADTPLGGARETLG